jgi:hypothetical protein
MRWASSKLPGELHFVPQSLSIGERERERERDLRPCLRHFVEKGVWRDAET